jgi:ribosomal protein S18 acetylase RimI-like enzyme
VTALFTRAARVDDVVPVHREAFPGFFMTQLGPRFLREYYRCVEAYPGGVLLTTSGEQGCIGFVAGFVDPASFYRELRRRRLRLGLAACAGIVTRPQRLVTLLANHRRARGAAHQPRDSRTAELSSLAVLPGAQGLGVGSGLVRAFVEAARVLGAERVLLTTDSDANEAVNSFYRRAGFSCVRSFEARPGRRLNEYALDIRKD